MLQFFTDIKILNHKLAEIIKAYSAVFILCDANTQKYCLPMVRSSFTDYTIILINSGEQNKNLETCIDIWERLTENVADRKSLLINLGGGVITDLGGFAAACYKRGIDFVNIPTTLLSMADASVGGKTGIDFQGFKNQIGLFSEAKEVLICTAFLKTLDKRQLRAGLAEIIKHYLIADGQAFRNFAESDKSIYESPDIELVQKAVAIKSRIVAQDPFEKGMRKKLNFGHTIGHALESFTLNSTSPLLHGEAIAFGMSIECFISAFKQLIDEKSAGLVCYVLQSTFGLQALPEDSIDPIIHMALQDKKNEDGVVKMALIDTIGTCKTDVVVSADEIKKAILYFNKSVDWYSR
jgi:3-dehydroquinate synthase